VIEAVWDDGFKRRYKKRVKRSAELQRQFWKRMEVFLTDPFSSQLRTHKLSGKLQGLWAFSIDDDHRVVFEFIDQ
jgi:mRNA-degrading endonuclease YafQ of YafQ-DinJ toxin-antitoxin module